jgi:hypothetical protein
MSRPLPIRSPLPALVLGLMISVCPATGYGWGNEGHEIVALVADHYLNSGVRAKVAALLARDSSGLTPTTGIADEATWADRFRDSDRNTTGQHYRQTREWHFINIELTRPDIDAACYRHPVLRPGSNASDGPATDCILDKIAQFHHELRGATTNPAERLLALQFLLHLVGDVHQPLHAADDHDRGGNDLRVQTATDPAGSLHTYWDTVFVERLGTRPDEVAAKLVARISADQRRSWSSGSPTDWANGLRSRSRSRVPMYTANFQGMTRARTPATVAVRAPAPACCSTQSTRPTRNPSWRHDCNAQECGSRGC